MNFIPRPSSLTLSGVKKSIFIQSLNLSLILFYFFHQSQSKPIVDKGVFVITGVKSCLGGDGYCILGNDCTVDKEFIPVVDTKRTNIKDSLNKFEERRNQSSDSTIEIVDLDLSENHCETLRNAFTPRAYFVCCQYVNQSLLSGQKTDEINKVTINDSIILIKTNSSTISIEPVSNLTKIQEEIKEALEAEIEKEKEKVVEEEEEEKENVKENVQLNSSTNNENEPEVTKKPVQSNSASSDEDSSVSGSNSEQSGSDETNVNTSSEEFYLLINVNKNSNKTEEEEETKNDHEAEAPSSTSSTTTTTTTSTTTTTTTTEAVQTTEQTSHTTEASQTDKSTTVKYIYDEVTEISVQESGIIQLMLDKCHGSYNDDRSENVYFYENKPFSNSGRFGNSRIENANRRNGQNGHNQLTPPSENIATDCYVGAIIRSPYSVVNYYVQDIGSYICTGALITNRHLITTATCVSRLIQDPNFNFHHPSTGEGNEEKTAKISLNNSMFKVVLGTNHLIHPSLGYSPNAVYGDIENIFIHENYYINHHLRINDIAVIKLKDEVPIDKSGGKICSICLPEINDAFLDNLLNKNNEPGTFFYGSTIPSNDNIKCKVSGFSHPVQPTNNYYNSNYENLDEDKVRFNIEKVDKSSEDKDKDEFNFNGNRNTENHDGILHEANQKVLNFNSYPSCRNLFFNFTLNNNYHSAFLNGNSAENVGLLCASGASGHEACFSPRDAGSPLTCDYVDEDETVIEGGQKRMKRSMKKKLIGLFSSGFHCGSMDSPVLYTDISSHRNWIIKMLVK